MPENQTLTTQELIDLIASREGKATILTLETCTELVAGKGKLKAAARNEFGNSVFKFSVVNGAVNNNYERAVQRQQVREGQSGEFQAEARSWGTRHGAFVVHGDKNYLTLRVISTKDPVYKDADGQTIANERIHPFLSARGRSARQGVEEQIIVCDYNIKNITAVRFNGVRYQIVHRGNAVVPTAA